METFLDFDKSSQGIVFTTDRSYQPGEQVTFFHLCLLLYCQLSINQINHKIFPVVMINALALVCCCCFQKWSLHVYSWFSEIWFLLIILGTLLSCAGILRVETSLVLNPNIQLNLSISIHLSFFLVHKSHNWLQWGLHEWSSFFI